MWRRINLAIDGFLVGMLFEYTLRVEVSVFPIAIGILIFIGILLDLWLYRLKGKRDELVVEINANVDKVISKNKKIKELTTVPKPWFVYDSGQNPLHMLWYVQLVNFDELSDESIEEPKQIFVEEADSYEEALSVAISRIKVADMRKV